MITSFVLFDTSVFKFHCLRVILFLRLDVLRAMTMSLATWHRVVWWMSTVVSEKPIFCVIKVGKNSTGHIIHLSLL